ncbi:MAG: phosphatase PAP2 family protein [Anaeromyxobacteraceae bacterium]
MRRLASAAAALLAIAACAGVGAKPPPRDGVAAHGAPALATALGAPPAAGSDEAKADLAIVLWMQRTRRDEDVARARRDIGLGLEAFASALGAGFDVGSHPRTRALIDRAHASATAPIRDAKARFRRARPYEADRRVTPAVPPEDTPSFPSSHATRGVLVARVLAALAPSRGDALRDCGQRVGFDRVLAGVHYPTDVLGGQRLGEALAAALLEDPAFARELEAVRAAEWVKL